MNRDQMNAAFGVTDEQLDSLAADYEAGDWKGRLGPVVQGRPRLYEEEMRTMDSSILELYTRGLIDDKTALNFAANQEVVSRAVQGGR